MLSNAEELYGRRNIDWTPVGVEFFECKNPHLWFPGNQDKVCIRLTMSALQDLPEALWQLSQEIVHILGPVRQATNLEEGVATHFALNSMHHTDKIRLQTWRAQMQAPESPYNVPLEDYESLLRLKPDIIKRLRTRESYLSRITADMLLKEFPECDKNLAARLTSFF
jgi:hypothetical protein